MESGDLTPEQEKEREQLKRENEILRQQIKSLREMENVIQHNASLKIVGKGAQRFEDELLQLNLQLKDFLSPKK